MRIILLLLVQIFFTLLSGCMSNELEENIDYPTTIFALDSEAYQDALNRYSALNDNQLCTSLDKYGFCKDDRILCTILRTPITDPNRILSITKAFVNKNIEFTGVLDTNKLALEFSYGLDGCIKCDGSPGDIKPIEWTYRFSNQIYKGYEVLNTTLYTYVNNDGVVRFGGHWYPKIAIPTHDSYSLKEARQSLIGDTITIHCLFPVITILSEDNIAKTARKVIFPIEKDASKIELRVAWEIGVAVFGMENGYLLYIDAMTGELIDQYEAIICD